MASKSVLTSVVIAFLLALLGADTASAYYAPQSGRFLSRDPIMYPDGANTYAAWYVPMSVDPFGLDVFLGRGFGPRCAGTMIDAHATADGNWERQAGMWGGPTTIGVSDPDDLLNMIRSTSCCDMALFGHRGNTRDGGVQNPGGIVTGSGSPDGNGLPSNIRLLPNQGVESDLGSAFRRNGCATCRISIFACSDGGPETAETLQSMAQSTGCVVCGALSLLILDELHTVGGNVGQPGLGEAPEPTEGGLFTEGNAFPARPVCPKKRPPMKCYYPWATTPRLGPPSNKRPPTWQWVPGAPDAWLPEVLPLPSIRN